MIRLPVLIAGIAVITAGGAAMGQAEGSTTAPAEVSVKTKSGTSATLSHNRATLTPKKGFADMPMDEMYGSLHEANRDIGKALQKVEETKKMIEEAKKKLPRGTVPQYLRILGGHDESTTTTETAEDIDELSTKTKARLKRAKERENEIRERLERGLF